MSSFGMMPPPVIRMSSRPCSLQQLAHAREQRHVRAAQDRQADDVDVFLDGGGGDHLRRLVQSGIDDFHAGVAERGGDDLGAAIVSVEAGLGNEYANGTHSGGSRVTQALTPATASRAPAWSKLALRRARGNGRPPLDLRATSSISLERRVKVRGVKPSYACSTIKPDVGAQLGEPRRRVEANLVLARRPARTGPTRPSAP